MTAVLDRLRDIVGPRNFIDAPDELEPYLVEGRGLFHGKTQAVLRPSSTEEAASTAKPRVSMARASRARKARSSSTIRSVLSASLAKLVSGEGEACRASMGEIS